MARPSLRPQWVHDEWIGRLVIAQTISGPAPLFDADGALIAPHRANRTKPPTQDRRRLSRYMRRWLVERFFAWIQWQRRILVRWEFHALDSERDRGLQHEAFHHLLINFNVDEGRTGARKPIWS